MTLKPNVVISYTGTHLAMRPEMKSKEVMTYLDALRQEGGVRHSSRAIPARPAQVKFLLSQPTAVDVRSTISFLWRSASRHGDLPRVHDVKHWPDQVQEFQWGAFKSDRYGVRAVSKFIPRDPRWNLEPCSYKKMLQTIQRYYPELTSHSLRRGAVTYLSSRGYSMKEIRLLTAHTPTEDPDLAVRRYVNPSPNQPESKLQLNMSRVLLEASL